MSTLLIVFITFWVLLFIKEKDLFAPWSLTLLVWIFVISGFLSLEHGLFDVTNQFIKGITLWVVSFCTTSYIVFRLTPSYHGPEWAINKPLVKFFALMALALVPFTLYRAIQSAIQMGGNNLMYAMRIQMLDSESGFSLGPLAYFIHVIYTILFISVDTKKKINKYFFAFCMAINFTFFLITMSKLILFIGILSTLYLLYIHKHIKLRTIVLICLAFATIGIVFTQMRTSGDGSTEGTFTFMELIGMYIFSPIVAFCQEHGNTSPVFAYETLRPLYHILEVLGIYHGPVYDGYRPYVDVPIPTNVYTMLAPFFNDFGYPGIVACSIIEAAIIAWVYKKAYTGHTIFRNIYAFLIVIICLQFFDDQFYVGISNILQMSILITICHVQFRWDTNDKWLWKKTN